jgi:chromosome segregation ATPase
MPFIRKRITKAGSVSTALVESSRNAKGKPCQRLIANLHGAETLEAALGKLVAERWALREELTVLSPEVPTVKEFRDKMALAALNHHPWTEQQRKEINQLLRQARQLMDRVEAINKDLARIQREGLAIKRHCSATKDAIQAEAAKHKKHLTDLKHLEIGLEIAGKGKSVKAQVKAMMEQN